MRYLALYALKRILTNEVLDTASKLRFRMSHYATFASQNENISDEHI